MNRCSICRSENSVSKCRNCKGSGNSPTGHGYCEMCNGERYLCENCQ